MPFPFTFKRLSPELRLQIFNLMPSLVSEVWNGKTPSIIKALRSEPRIHREAMEVFAKNQTYALHVGNNWSFDDMLVTAILTIRKVKIIIDVNIKPCKGKDWNEHVIFEPAGSQYICLRDLAASARLLQNVRDVDIEFVTAYEDGWYRTRQLDPAIQENESGLHWWAHENYWKVVAGFERLSRVSMIFPLFPNEQRYNADGTYGVASLNDLYNDNYTASNVAAGNKAFGVHAKLDSVSEITDKMKDLDKYIWISEEGKYLQKQNVHKAEYYNYGWEAWPYISKDPA